MDDSTHFIAMFFGLCFLVFGIRGIVRNQMSIRLGYGNVFPTTTWKIVSPYARPYGFCLLVSAAVLLVPRVLSLLTAVPLDIVPSTLSVVFGLLLGIGGLFVVLFVQILVFILNAVKPKPASSEDTSRTS